MHVERTLFQNSPIGQSVNRNACLYKRSCIELILMTQEVGRVQLNVATPTYATVAYSER